MYRHIVIWISCLLLSASMGAQNDVPIIEIKADRAMIYPQRMELTGEETLMDILQMVPELMIAGYEDVIGIYNLRIDNCPVNGDTRLILSQMKAKDIAKIQVCDNTGVAKGTIGMGGVMDINMKMPEKVKGFVEGQGDFGKDAAGIGTVNALYGSKGTDLYANTSYRHQDGNEEYLTLHMTNRFDDRNRLLTYFTQQYLDHPSATSRKVMGRARYFHTFNDMGTELLFLMTRQKGTDRSWDVFNYDIYLQLTYSLPKWRFTVGKRVMFYNYKLMEAGTSQKDSNTRDNVNACVIFVPDNRNQIQLGYYRKYYNPSYIVLFMDANKLIDEEWAITKGLLEERTINQVKLAYAYSKQKLTVQTEASYYAVEDGENFTELGASAYWKTNGLTLAGGSNFYAAKSGGYASFRIAPTVYLPHEWQIGMQMVYYTKKSPRREITGVPVYGCLSVNKQFGKNWNMGVDWHDMFDAFCSDAEVNRHAANIRLQYRF